MPDVPPAPPPGEPTAPPELAAAIVETSTLGFCTTDASLRLTYANPALAAILERSPAELVGTPAMDLVHPDDRALAADAVAELLDRTGRLADAGVPLRLRLLRADGRPVAVALGGVAALEHPVIGGVAIRVAPLRGQGEVDAALRAMARDAELAEILDLLLDAIDGVVDDGRTVMVVDELPSRAQWSVPDDVDPLLRELPGPTDTIGPLHPGIEALESGDVVVRLTADLPSPMRDVAAAAGFGAVWAFPLVTRSFRAVVFVWRHRARQPQVSSRQAISTIVGIAGLAIERHRARMALDHVATHDPLTGLSNQTAFTRTVGRAVVAPATAARQLGVLHLDLDGLRPVNDELGVRAGHSVLREAAARISAAVRDTDLVARTGGDEFAVLCPDIEDADVLPRVAARILRAFEEPFVLDRGTVHVTVSIGIAVTPLDHDASVDVESLLAQADAALGDAKRAGRGTWAVSPTPTAG